MTNEKMEDLLNPPFFWYLSPLFVLAYFLGVGFAGSHMIDIFCGSKNFCQQAFRLVSINRLSAPLFGAGEQSFCRFLF